MASGASGEGGSLGSSSRDYSAVLSLLRMLLRFFIAFSRLRSTFARLLPPGITSSTSVASSLGASGGRSICTGVALLEGSPPRASLRAASSSCCFCTR